MRGVRRISARFYDARGLAEARNRVQGDRSSCILWFLRIAKGGSLIVLVSGVYRSCMQTPTTFHQLCTCTITTREHVLLSSIYCRPNLDPMKFTVKVAWDGSSWPADTVLEKAPRAPLYPLDFAPGTFATGATLMHAAPSQQNWYYYCSCNPINFSRLLKDAETGWQYRLCTASDRCQGICCCCVEPYFSTILHSFPFRQTPCHSKLLLLQLQRLLSLTAPHAGRQFWRQ